MATSNIVTRALLPVIFVALAALTACSSGGSSSSALLGPDGLPVGATLLNASIISGDQEVPPVATAGTGSASVVVSADQSQIDLTLNIDGTFTSAITQAHFHNGAIGVNGPVTLFICSNLGNAPANIPAPPACPQSPAVVTRSYTAADFIPVPGLATFADLVNAVLNGGTYINVHTVTNPGGEIRGQVGGAVFDTALSSGISTTTGAAAVILDRTQSRLDFTMTHGAFATPTTMAHIHLNAPPADPALFFLCSNQPLGTGPAAPACTGSVSGTLTADNFIPGGGLTTFAEAVNALITGNTYINVHTEAVPTGEIRGTLGGTLDANAQVVFVNNTAVGGDGSINSPFSTLAAAAAASAEGDIIFVFAGDGTDAGQNTGITLKSGQKLIGEGTGLALGGSFVVQPGQRPLISNAGLAVGGNTPVVMLNTANEVSGLAIQADFNEGVLALSGTGHTVSGNTFTFDAASGREGVRLLNVSGNITVSNNTMTGSPRSGIKLANNEDQAGNLIVAPATVATLTTSGNTITNSARDGINVTLDGAGTNVMLRMLGNSISNPIEEGVDIDVLGAANIASRIEGNDLTNGIQAVNAQTNATSTICLELLNNGNVGGTAGFLANNNSTGAFNLAEAGNDNLAARSGIITDVAQGTCGVP